MRTYHLGHVVRRSLQKNAGSHYDSEHEHGPSTTQLLADEEREDRPDEASEIIDRGHEALHGW